MDHPIFKKIQGSCNSIKIELTEPIENTFQANLNSTYCEESLTNNTIIEEDSPVQSSDESIKKILNTEERLSMQLSLEKQKTHVLVVEKLTVISQNKKLIIQNYELRIKQINDEIRFITEQTKQDQSALKEMQGDHANLVKKLTDKYALKPDWKFDTETGEII